MQYHDYIGFYTKCGDPYFEPCMGSSKVHTPTPWKHPEQWAAIYGEVEGSVPCSRAPQSQCWESAVHSHPPTYLPTYLQFLPDRDSNSQPFDYESDSLTIRPWLPTLHCQYLYRIIWNTSNLVLSHAGWSQRSVFLTWTFMRRFLRRWDCLEKMTCSLMFGWGRQIWFGLLQSWNNVLYF